MPCTILVPVRAVARDEIDADHTRYCWTVSILFYSFDCNEPKHVHVRRERKVYKFWLEPIALISNNGFSAKELNRIRALIRDEMEHILETWNEHCGE